MFQTNSNIFQAKNISCTKMNLLVFHQHLITMGDGVFVILKCANCLFLGGLRVANPTIRLMISVCPSVTFWLFDGHHFVNSITTKTTALTSQCVMSMN